MDLNKVLVTGLTTLILFISVGNGDEPQPAARYGGYALEPQDSQDLNEMIDNCSAEIIRGYHKAIRVPEEDISSEPGDIHFYLYSNPDNASEYEEIHYNWNVQSHKLNVIPDAPWKILIHGFLQDRDSSPFPQLLVKEYLKRWKRTGKPYNILVVDWGKLAYSVKRTWQLIPIYSKAVQNVAVAGKRIGDFIKWLKRSPISNDPIRNSTDDHTKFAITDFTTVHIIGFSLGAHVAGKAGQTIFNKFSTHVGRITGLDPAGPRFYSGVDLPGRKLKRKDANCMDIIHTSWNTFGIGEEIGDADFYPNAGYFPMQAQPWCMKNAFLAPHVCSHNLAPLYFAFSINHPNAMEACQCGSYWSFRTICSCRYKGTMGEDWQISQLGRYYLSVTNNEVDGSIRTMKQRVGQKYLNKSTLTNTTANRLHSDNVQSNRIRD